MLTTGDLKYNPTTNHWEPIGGNPLPPFIPSGGDPVVAGQPMGLDARASQLAELERLGLPVPPQPREPFELSKDFARPGGQQTLLTEGAEVTPDPVVVELSDLGDLGELSELGELVADDDDDPTTVSGE